MKGVQSVEDYSKTEDVAFGMFGARCEHLRSQVARGSTLFEEVVRVVHVMGHPQIDDHRPQSVLLFTHHDVFQFDVAVEDAP